MDVWLISTGSSISYSDDTICLPFSLNFGSMNLELSGGVVERLSVHRSMSAYEIGQNA